MKRRSAILFLVAFASAPRAHAHPTAFLVAPRTTGKFLTQSVSERGGPYVYHADAGLVIRDDAGVERVLMTGGVLDFSVSNDGQSLLVSKVTDNQSDLYWISVATGQQVRITNTANAWECQAVEANDCIAYLSNEDGWKSPHDAYQAYTIYCMEKDGSRRERIWHAGIGGVFGLSIAPNGRLLFSSGESQGFHGGRGVNWSAWSVNTDGSDFQPEMSATAGPRHSGQPFDWPAITSDGSLVVAWYYDTRIYGMLVRCPPVPITVPTKFGDPLWSKSTNYIRIGYARGGAFPEYTRLGFERRGMHSLALFAGNADWEMRDTTGLPVGMLSHPMPIPDNGIYCTWTGDEGDALMDLGVYAIPDVDPADGIPLVAEPGDLVRIVDRSDRHEWMGRPVVPFAAIYDVSQPPQSRGEVAKNLPPGVPYALIGTSGVDWNEWAVGGEWGWEDPGLNNNRLIKMPPDEAEYVRILGMQPNPAATVLSFERIFNGSPRNERDVNWFGLSSEINEVVGWYGDPIPLKKWRRPDGGIYVGPDPPANSTRLLRSDGSPDNSFAAIIPANQPWAPQLLNAKGEAIDGSTAQTWHQAIPGEKRTDCQGCHAHHAPDPIPYNTTWAAWKGYKLHKLKKFNTVEYQQDIAPRDGSINPRPWDSTDAGIPRTYGSSLTTVDDNLPTAELRGLYRKWLDTGCMAAGKYANGTQIQPGDNAGPYADTMEPTVTAEFFTNYSFVGAMDPNSGLASLSIVHGGEELIDEYAFSANWDVWVGPPLVGEVTITATDEVGNETTIARIAEPTVPVRKSVVRKLRTSPELP